jgi:hypothetical protein
MNTRTPCPLMRGSDTIRELLRTGFWPLLAPERTGARAIAIELAAMSIADQRERDTDMVARCTGCGSAMTDAEIIEKRLHNPKLRACCPERKMTVPGGTIQDMRRHFEKRNRRAALSVRLRDLRE